MIRLQLAVLAWLLQCAAGLTAERSSDDMSRVGYTQYQCDLPGGRHANIRTMRSVISKTDGSQREMLCENLIDNPNAWTQFVGWSPDRQSAIVARGWQSPENAQWEDEHKTFRFTAEAWSLDSFLVDLKSRQISEEHHRETSRWCSWISLSRVSK